MIIYLRKAAICAATVSLLILQSTLAQSEPTDMTICSTTPETSATTSTIVYIGTYTGKGSEGIYRFRLDPQSTTLQPDGLAAKISNPSFLALAPDHRHLYCVNEISDFQGKKSGAATSYEIDPANGDLHQIDQAPSGGTGPCYISVTPNGKAALVANYGSGSVALLPITAEGGLEEPTAVAQHAGSSVVKSRQDAPHAHSIRPDPTGRYALSCDLGIDQIICYRIADDGHSMDTSAPVVNKTKPGAGPRHMAFSPNGKVLYNSNELNNTVTAWNWSLSDGRLTEIESTSTLPADFKGENTVAEILVHPSGRFLYVSNRGHNSVATFQIDPASGKLTLVGHEATRGTNPRGMSLDPSGKLLIVANQDSDNLVVFRVDEQTGLPNFASQYDGVSQPVAIQFF